MRFTFNAFKILLNLFKLSLKSWYNILLYIILGIGIYIDWNDKISSQGGISFFSIIIFGYVLIVTYYISKENGNTTG